MGKGKLSLLLLALASLACMTTLPVEPAPAALEVKSESTPAAYPVPTPELTRIVCMTADAVNLRAGAGTGFESVAVLSAGDTLTLTGELVIAPDMGLWWPVRSGSLDGFINAKYVCQAFGKNEIISETPASITVKDEGYDFAKNVHVYSVTVVEE